MHSFCKYRSPWREQRHLELETWNSWYCWTNMQRSKLSSSKVMNCVKSARHLSALHRETHPWSPFFNIPAKCELSNVDTECRIAKPRRFLKECLRQFCGGCCGDGMMSQWCVSKSSRVKSNCGFQWERKTGEAREKSRERTSATHFSYFFNRFLVDLFLFAVM